VEFIGAHSASVAGWPPYVQQSLAPRRSSEPMAIWAMAVAGLSLIPLVIILGDTMLAAR